MKKFLLMGVLALTVAALLEHQAWAWKNCNFSAGLNWSSSSGGNNFMWGVFRNGQPGQCDLPNCPSHFYAVQHGYQPYGYGHAPAGPFMAPAPAPVPAPTPVPGAQSYYYYGQPTYQTVNYGYGR